MQNESIIKIKTDIATFSVSIEKRTDVVGYIYYNMSSKQWSFEYHDLFKDSRYCAISSFPELDRKYNHMEVVTWLMSRVAEHTDIEDMKIKVRENIRLKDNKNLSYRLEILHIQ